MKIRAQTHSMTTSGLRAETLTEITIQENMTQQAV